RRRHTRSKRDWSSDVCSSDLRMPSLVPEAILPAVVGSCATAEQVAQDPTTAGKIASGTKLRILGKDGREKPRGEIGEIFLFNERSEERSGGEGGRSRRRAHGD